METIKLYDFQLEFVKDLLREHLTSRRSDMDTRLLARDVLNAIENQVPEKEYEISLLTGELVTI